MNHFKPLHSIVLLAFIFCTLNANAQEEDASYEDYLEMSLEDLMNIPIESTSKKAERLFDAALSSYTITKDDIINAGVTSIPEALRLSPGVIVRETTNGSYDIHIRGLDGISRGAVGASVNTLTLVMIDNRPVFNNNVGGTIWESLSISVFDVERIEIVRGPSAPLFGPNAVTGVINILTKEYNDESGIYARANTIIGTQSSSNSNVSLGFRGDNNLSFNVNGNFSQRDRFDETFFTGGGAYVTADQLRGALGGLNIFPNEDRALRKYGINGTVTYEKEDLNIRVTGGHQDADVITPFYGTFTNYSDLALQSSYVDIAGKIKNLSIQYSLLDGHDELEVGIPQNQYDYRTQNLALEYDLNIGEKLVIRPGFSYQRAVYDDREFTVEEGLNGFLNGEFDINTVSGSIRSEFNPTDKLRLIVAARMDNFSTDHDSEFSYQAALTYKPNESSLLRLAHSKSTGGAFVGPSFLSLNGQANGAPARILGNESAKVNRAFMYEVGYRQVLGDIAQLDLDIFYQTARDFGQYVPSGIDFTGAIPVALVPWTNLPHEAEQLGSTISLNIFPSTGLNIRPFVTIQSTEVKDFPRELITPVAPLPDLNNTFSYDHEHTPSVYGGFDINYRVNDKLRFNLNSYYFSAHTQYNGLDIAQITDAGDIDGKFILNATANYMVNKYLSLQLIGRNLLDQDSPDFFAGDNNGTLLYGGLRVSL